MLCWAVLVPPVWRYGLFTSVILGAARCHTDHGAGGVPSVTSLACAGNGALLVATGSAGSGPHAVLDMEEVAASTLRFKSK